MLKNWHASSSPWMQMVVVFFKGSKINVITLVKGTMVPFTMGLHYFVHHTNLAMLVLSRLSLVIQLEVLLQVINSFFSH